MSEGKRPGGLTALAVINFVFAGFAALGVLGVVLLLFLGDMVDEASRREIEKVPMWFWYASAALALVSVVLLIMSGVGFLQQKRILGRLIGNVYGVLSLAAVGVQMAVAPLNFGVVINLVYPVLVLVLINTTFRDDLVR